MRGNTMKITFITLILIGLLSSCSSDYSNVKVLSIRGHTVEYKVIMDSGSYSPGIIVTDGKITFPKCSLRTECDVTYKSEGGMYNKYTVVISDKKILKELKKLMK